MVRKTKEDAELTRQRIIDAAREVFLVRGVSRTTIEQVAAQAQVTRGAVYWHFSNKSDLFHAMREQVLLPLLDRLDTHLLESPDTDPLTSIENCLASTLSTLENCEITRQTYEILMTKCEYVDDLISGLEQVMTNCQTIVGKFEAVYHRARQQDLLNPRLDPAQLAMDTHLFFFGLLHLWVKDSKGTQVRGQARELIHAHIQLRRR